MPMRTTLAIDDDVLSAARQIAASQEKSVCEVISDLARTALRPAPSRLKTRNGIPLLPIQPGRALVSSELVRQLDDELPRLGSCWT